MMHRDYRAEFEALLEEQGGLYTFDDVMQCLHEGKMQSFAEGNTLVITQVHDFPRKRVLELAYILGDFDALATIEKRVQEYKEEIGAHFVIGTGRMGWLRKNTGGWKPHSINFVKV